MSHTPRHITVPQIAATSPAQIPVHRPPNLRLGIDGVGHASRHTTGYRLDRTPVVLGTSAVGDTLLLRLFRKFVLFDVVGLAQCRVLTDWRADFLRTKLDLPGLGEHFDANRL